MKKILFLIGGLLSSLAINAQVLSYGDAAILFSMEENNGTARFNAMSGAFGALGGDLSASGVNPAGLAVFKNSQASVSFGLRNTDIISTFGGNSINNNDNYLNLTQAGGVLVFNNHGSHWSKFAIGFNYSIAKDYENIWFADGNSGFAPITDFYDPDLVYSTTENQTFDNYTNGKNDKFVLTFAAQPNEKLYIGAAITTHNLNYNQLVIAEEFNNDGIGSEPNTFDVSAQQELYTSGDGVSFGIGIIAKPSQEVRLGVAVQSPTWYELSEEVATYEDVLFFNGEADNNGALTDINVFDYNFYTPARFTGSFAYILGKEGLISIDYTYKDFKNIKLKPSNLFSDENNDFSNNLKGTSTFRIGTEWRLENVSLRGGYHFEQSPFENALDSENIEGYSFGIGFKFGGNVKLDLAYQNSTNTDVYDFLNVEEVNPTELDIRNDKFTATLVIGL